MFRARLNHLPLGCLLAAALAWLHAAGPGDALAHEAPPVRLVFADKLPPLSFVAGGLTRGTEFEAALGRKRSGNGYVAILETYGLTPGTPY